MVSIPTTVHQNISTFSLLEISANETRETECYGASDDDLKDHKIITFWVELLVQNIVAGIGIVFNLIAIPILCKYVNCKILLLFPPSKNYIFSLVITAVLSS